MRDRHNINRLLNILLLSLFLVAVFLPLEAGALSIKMNLEDLTREADSVIVGTVTGTESQWDTENGNIFTTVTIYIEDTFKGDPLPNLVSVIVPGGTVNGVSQIVSDTPAFQQGEDVVLFLNKLPWYALSFQKLEPHFYEVCGNFQGKLKVTGDTVFEMQLDEFAEEVNSVVEDNLFSPALNMSLQEPEFISSHQFVPLPFRWPTPSPMVPYYVNAGPESTSQINAAAATWNGAGANFAFSYKGQHTRSGGAFKNNKNEVQGTFMSHTTALAIASIWTSNGYIEEADMTFNTRYNWGSMYDVQTVALHEFGHWVGLNHCEVSGSIMFTYYQGVQRSLHQVDIDGIRYIYGAASTVVPCTVTAPLKPTGTASGTTGTDYYYNTTAHKCSIGHNLQYQYQFGDQTLSNWNNSTNVKKSWPNPGVYQVQVRARCAVDINKVSAWSPSLTVEISAPVVTYSLTLTIDGQGTTTPAAGTHQVKAGETISLKASPAEGWNFVKWNLNGVDSADQNESITINANSNVTALFIKDQSQLTDDDDNEEENGEETGETDEQDQDEQNTEAEQYTLTINISGQGATSPVAGSYTDHAGTVLSFLASPASGWQFDKWIVGSEEHFNPHLQVTLDQNLIALAIFSEISDQIAENPDQGNGSTPPSSGSPAPPAVEQYDLVLTKHGEGTVSPAEGHHTYNKGSDVLLKALPAEGWRFDKWIIDDLEFFSPEVKITINSKRNALAFFSKATQGDITGDGNITVNDVVILVRYSLGTSQLTVAQMASADVNGDGVIDVRDITLLMQYALGMIDSF